MNIKTFDSLLQILFFHFPMIATTTFRTVNLRGSLITIFHKII